MITTDANQTIDRLFTILENEIEFHKFHVLSVKDVGKDVIEYLKYDIEKLNELKKSLFEYKLW